MKFLIVKLIVFSLLISFCACNDDDCTCKGEIYGKWEVLDYISLESSYHSKYNDFNPTIKFNKDESIEINLDANSCWSDFELTGDSGINIGNAGCTKMCCDSDFSLKIIEMLPQVGSYEIEENKLKLHVSGWGWINLKWVSD